MILGSVNMVYPDEVVFSNDRNVIELKYIVSGSGSVGGLFTLTNANSESVQIEYNSEQKYLAFNLFSVFKKLLGDDSYTTITMSGSVGNGTSTANITPVAFKLCDGRTLHSRPHNAETVVYYYDSSDLYATEILSLYGGTVNQTGVQPGITKFNWTTSLPSFDVIQVDGEDRRVIHFQRAALGGDSSFSSGCSGDGAETSFGVMKFKYTNTDGCWKHLQGKVISRKRSVGITDWRADDIVRHTPHGMITSTTDEVTVGFPGVKRGAYAEDIMFSPIIYYQREDGEWEPCMVSSKSIQLQKWDENDIEITFQTLA